MRIAHKKIEGGHCHECQRKTAARFVQGLGRVFGFGSQLLGMLHEEASACVVQRTKKGRLFLTVFDTFAPPHGEFFWTAPADARVLLFSNSSRGQYGAQPPRPA